MSIGGWMAPDDYRQLAAGMFQDRAQRQQRGLDAQAFEQSAMADVRWLDRQRDAHLGITMPTYPPAPEPVQEQGGLGDLPVLGGLSRALDFSNVPVIGGITGATGTFLGGALDLLGRPATAVAGTALGLQGDERAGGNPFEGFWRGLTGTPDERSDFNFATVLENQGVENEFVRNVAGMGLSLLTDPSNLIAPLGGTRLLQRGFEAGVRGALHTPILRTALDSFAPHLGPLPITVLMREYESLGLDPGVLKSLETLNRRSKAISRTSAGFAVKEVKAAIGDVPKQDQQAALRLLIQHHGTPIENAQQAATTVGQRKVVDYVYERFGYKPATRATKSSFGEIVPSDFTPPVEPGFTRVYRGTSPNSVRKPWKPKPGDSGVELRHYTDDPLEAGKYGAEGGSVSYIDLSDKEYADYIDFSVSPFMADTGATRYRLPASLDSRAQPYIEAGDVGKPKTVVTPPRQGSAEYIGDIAKLGRDEIGIRPVSGSYIHAMYADRIADAAMGRAKRQSIGKAQSRIRTPAESLADPDLIDDAALVIAHDIATVKTVAAFNQITSKTTLQSILFREVKAGTEPVFDRNTEALFRPKEVTSKFLTEREVDLLGKTVSTKKIPLHQETWIGPKETVRALENLRDPYHWGGITSYADAIGGLWKPTVTVWAPAFHIRNLISNAFLATQAGMYNPMWFARSMHVQKGHDLSIDIVAKGAAKRAAAGNPVPGNGKFEMNNLDYMRNLNEAGLLNTGTSVARTTEELQPNMIGRLTARIMGQAPPTELNRQLTNMEQMKIMLDGGAKKGGFPWIFAAGRTVNEAVDNNAKIAHHMFRLAEGDTFQEAVDASLKAFPAYVEFASSKTFRSVRSFIPFASWSRFNVPKQLEYLITRPEIAAKVGILSPSLAEVNEQLKTDAAMLPDWVLERHNVLLGKNDDGTLEVLYGLGLPIEDLNQLFSLSPGRTIERFASQMAPYLRAFLEVPSDHSFFTGGEISDPSMSNFYRHAWEFTAAVPGVRDWLGVTKRTLASGDDVYQADPYAMYYLSAILGRFGGTIDQLGDVFEGRKSPLGALSLGTGVKIGTAYPKPEPGLPLNSAIANDPALAQLYDQYKSIPIYDGLSADQGNRADRALNATRSHRNYLLSAYPGIDDEQAWQEAFKMTEAASTDPEATALARMIHQGGIPSSGRELRKEFKRQYPALIAAIEEISPAALEYSQQLDA